MFEKGYDYHGWNINLRWLDTVLSFNSFVLIKYKVSLKYINVNVLDLKNLLQSIVP